MGPVTVIIPVFLLMANGARLVSTIVYKTELVTGSTTFATTENKLPPATPATSPITAFSNTLPLYAESVNAGARNTLTVTILVETVGVLGGKFSNGTGLVIKTVKVYELTPAVAKFGRGCSRTRLAEKGPVVEFTYENPNKLLLVEYTTIVLAPISASELFTVKITVAIEASSKMVPVYEGARYTGKLSFTSVMTTGTKQVEEREGTPLSRRITDKVYWGTASRLKDTSDVRAPVTLLIRKMDAEVVSNAHVINEFIVLPWSKSVPTREFPDALNTGVPADASSAIYKVTGQLATRGSFKLIFITVTKIKMVLDKDGMGYGLRLPKSWACIFRVYEGTRDKLSGVWTASAPETGSIEKELNGSPPIMA